ncbi:patatin-like phospholipase family protein [Candidatus Peregrinibacteria bacterium]|nr:patatin-like phospholipase family protein [Candidatus Peregrinibacteria bacterium]
MGKRKKIGLALGGGGARGCAHIGVIKALNEAGIPIDRIAGTSIGSFIGGVYVAGDISELESYLLKIKWKDVVKHFDPVIPKKGFFEGKKICELIGKLLKHKTFQGNKIPFRAVATDLFSGKEVILKTGNMTQAIRSSIAIPGIFTPVKKGNVYLIDGGVVNPVPINVVRDMGADIVIAVDLNHNFIREKMATKRSYGKEKGRIYKWLTPTHPNIIDVIENSVYMMQDKLTEKNLLIHQPDFLIRPTLGSASIFDFHKAKGLIEEGYQKTRLQIPRIKKELGLK